MFIKYSEFIGFIQETEKEKRKPIQFYILLAVPSYKSVYY